MCTLNSTPILSLYAKCKMYSTLREKLILTAIGVHQLYLIAII